MSRRRMKRLGLVALVLAVSMASTNSPLPSAPRAVTAATLPLVTVTGVAVNNSSAKIDFNPVPGAKDYRVFDVSNPTVVKYAGLVHVVADPWNGMHFVMQPDGVTPVYPLQAVSNSSGSGPNALDIPATEIEWNKLWDGQPHTLVVQALDRLGPAPADNLYDTTNNSLIMPMPSGAMLGANAGPTADGNTSINGQGPSTNAPQVIAQSAPFVAQANPSVLPIPSKPEATQTFLDTFDNSEANALQQVGLVDPVAGTMTYTLNAGTPKAWTIQFQTADTNDSMPMVEDGHFMDVLFDGGTPGHGLPLHIAHGLMAMSPQPTVDFGGGKLLHLTMEVDGHVDSRRWLAFNLAPANDPLTNWYPTNGVPINNSDTALFFQLFPGLCDGDIYTGPTSSSDATPLDTRFWGAAGQATNMCYPTTHWGGNGNGFDNRVRYDLFLTQTHAALFADGQLVIQSDIPGGVPFSQAKVYYSHYVYHTALDQQEELQSDCFPMNSYWFNDPVNGTAASADACNQAYPAGYGFPYSDERHWDNMGFEVLPASDVPASNDFSSLANLIHLPTFVPPTLGTTTPGPATNTPVPATGTTNPTNTSMPTSATSTSRPPTSTPVPPTNTPAGATATPAPTGQWVNISPPGVSTNPNSPASNYGFQTVATDPRHPGTVYVGTCYQGLWKTTDGGNTWAKVNTGTNGPNLDTGRIWSLAVDPFNANTLYAVNGYGSGQGLWKSTDGGVDWSQMFSQSIMQSLSADVYDVTPDPYLANHVLVAFHGGWGGGADAGILESFDGGATWTIHNPISGWGAGHYIMFLNNSSTWLLATQYDGFWRTSDSGATWTQVSTQNMQHGGEEIYHAANGAWYTGSVGALLRSTDNGASWTTVTPVAGTPDGYNAVIGDGTTLYAQPANTGAANSPHSYYVSPENGGTTWVAQNNQSFSDGPMSMAYDPVNHVVYSSNWDGGVWKLQVSGGQSSPTPQPTQQPPTNTPKPTNTPAAATNTPAPATNTPVPPSNTPVPATSTPTQMNVSIDSVSAGPASVPAGGSETINTTVSTNAPLSGAIVDFEVYDTSGTKVYQYYDSGVNFAANSPQTFNELWPVPSGQAPGMYRAKIGVFASGWTGLYAWNDTGATFNVIAAAPTTTSVPPTNTPKPTSTPAPPTNTPVPPTNTPIPVSITPVVSIANVNSGPADVAPGATEYLTATVVSSISLSGAIVNFAIYNASNTRVYQTSLQGISLSGSTSRLFTARWSVPLSQPVGAYRLKVGVYGKHWQPLYAWASAQNTFTVGGIHAATKRSRSRTATHRTYKARPMARLGEGQVAHQSG